MPCQAVPASPCCQAARTRLPPFPPATRCRPLADKAWACTNPATDAACAALLANTDVAAVSAGFCALSRSQWQWTQPHAKLVSRFNLVCGDAYKAQIANSFFFAGYLLGSEWAQHRDDVLRWQAQAACMCA
jgi:hypothetical protein